MNSLPVGMPECPKTIRTIPNPFATVTTELRSAPPLASY